jgi:hypothetical protein
MKIDTKVWDGDASDKIKHLKQLMAAIDDGSDRANEFYQSSHPKVEPIKMLKLLLNEYLYYMTTAKVLQSFIMYVFEEELQILLKEIDVFDDKANLN